MIIRIAKPSDIKILAENDKHIGYADLTSVIDARRILILEIDHVFAGWLRWNLFWDSIPFMNMLYLHSPFRGLGYGKKLVAEWEASMQKQGYSQIMTSTQADEAAQHFYRKLGYADCGCLYPAGQIATEILFRKSL